MRDDPGTLYRALIARDRRFDGLFFVGVTSTRIYCRPICPAKTPKEKNCRFYRSASEAEQAGFRPCLRCRPELAPGQAPVDGAERIAQRVVQRIEEGEWDEKKALEEIAAECGLSSRQMRRIVQNVLGVPPVQLLLTRRLLLARQLLTETNFPVTQIAFASGFSSLRRFNDAFRRRYGIAPTGLRKASTGEAAPLPESGSSSLLLSYRPPYDWEGMLTFLRARALKGVEFVDRANYKRTVRLGDVTGWIKLSRAGKREGLMLEFSNGLTPVLPALLSRVRDLFDLNARPEIIGRQFAKDRILRPLVKANPGLRVPGAFHGFELGLRAILGQQVTVKAATTVAGRIVGTFGEAISTPFQELNCLTPTPEALARASVDQLARLGIPAARCRSILALAKAHVTGELSLERGSQHDPERMIKELEKLPGIGMWTANYIAMRALRWPDAFPSGDIVIRNSLGGVSAAQAEEISEAWRPWRSYAVLHLWRNSKELQRMAAAMRRE